MESRSSQYKRSVFHFTSTLCLRHRHRPEVNVSRVFLPCRGSLRLYGPPRRRGEWVGVYFYRVSRNVGVRNRVIDRVKSMSCVHTTNILY